MTDRSTQAVPTISPLPRHVAIIMDGNNRWAKAHQRSSISGHRAGVEAVRAVIEVALRQGIEALTLFAFSSENWKRPQHEVSGLMELFLWALKRETKRLNKYQVRLRVIGDRSRFSEEIQRLIQQAEAQTCHNQRMDLVIAANYGGQWDLAHAAQLAARDVANGILAPDDIDEAYLSQYICLNDLPTVDLCIRTSGEQRISNFLLWQLAYAELLFVDTLWPDFKQAAFTEALQEFAGRQRRFGGR